MPQSIQISLRGMASEAPFMVSPLRDQGIGDFLTVQWLRLCASTEESVGSIPGQEMTICQKKKKEKEKGGDICIPMADSC